MATTMHRLRGSVRPRARPRLRLLFDVINLPRITNAQIEDAIAIHRRLWHGEVVLDHYGPAGTYPYLFLRTWSRGGDPGILWWRSARRRSRWPVR